MVAVRLIVVSFVVGIVLETFGLDPATLFAEVLHSVRQIVEIGFSDIHEVGRILHDRGHGRRPGVACAADARLQQTVGDRRMSGRMLLQAKGLTRLPRR